MFIVLWIYTLAGELIMQVNNTTPVFAGKDIRITKDTNKGRQFLYGEVLDIIRKTPVPAVFANEGITISSPESKSLTKVLGDLTKAGINFDTIV